MSFEENDYDFETSSHSKENFMKTFQSVREFAERQSLSERRKGKFSVEENYSI
jgi:hypothetical protein